LGTAAIDLPPYLHTSACFITTEYWSILINDEFKLLNLFTDTVIAKMKLGMIPRYCQIYKVQHPKHISQRQATWNDKEQNMGITT